MRGVVRPQRPGQPEFPGHHRDELDLRAREVDRGRRAVQARHLPGRPDHLGQRAVLDQHVVDGRDAHVVVHVQRGRRIALRIQVDDQDAQAVLSQAGGQVDGGGRLADPALLVGDRQDPAARRPRPGLPVGQASHAHRGLRSSPDRGVRLVARYFRNDDRRDPATRAARRPGRPRRSRSQASHRSPERLSIPGPCWAAVGSRIRCWPAQAAEPGGHAPATVMLSAPAASDLSGQPNPAAPCR